MALITALIYHIDYDVLNDNSISQCMIFYTAGITISDFSHFFKFKSRRANGTFRLGGGFFAFFK